MHSWIVRVLSIRRARKIQILSSLAERQWLDSVHSVQQFAGYNQRRWTVHRHIAEESRHPYCPKRGARPGYLRLSGAYLQRTLELTREYRTQKTEYMTVKRHPLMAKNGRWLRCGRQTQPHRSAQEYPVIVMKNHLRPYREDIILQLQEQHRSRS